MKRRTQLDLLSKSNGSLPLNPSDGDAVLDLARKLADGSRPAMLGTLDDHGQPRFRWIATLGLDDFPNLYAITSPAHREIADLDRRPVVNWMFSNPAMTLVVNLTGKTEVVRDAGVFNRAWKQMGERTRALFHQCEPGHQGMTLIKTEVERIECTLLQDKVKALSSHPTGPVRS